MLMVLQNLLHALSPFIKGDKYSETDKAIFCPYHNDYHTRGGEAAFPLVFWGQLMGADHVVEKGLSIADWLVRRQKPDGGWEESPGTWKGTTVFQLMALSAVLDTCGSDLSSDRKTLYGSAVANAVRWVHPNINFRRTTTNYVASAAAGLALANKLLPEKGWDKWARCFARMAAGRINKDGLIEGEGVGKRVLKKLYFKSKGIDIGYGLEMTLSALALYLLFVDDDRVFSAFRQALQSHALFLYPDGSLDDSIGSRGYKWTIYGSKTTHGSQMALAFGAVHDPQFGQALRLTTDCLRKYARNGLLPDGPHIDPKGSVSCLYPTITRATNLAFALRYFPRAEASHCLGPKEAAQWVRKFATLNSLIVRRIPWKATVSGYHYRARYPRITGWEDFHVPGGGALTQLFHDEWGLIQAATQLDYQQVELLHIPKVEGHLLSFTPRIVLQSASGVASNVYSSNTKIIYRECHDGIIVTASGNFFSPGPGCKKVNSYFNTTYTFSGNSVNKEYVINLAHPVLSMAIIEPIVVQDGTELDLSPGGLSLLKDGKRMICQFCTPSGHWSVFDRSAISCPLPSLMGMCVQCKWDRPYPGQYEVGVNIVIE